MPRPSWQKPCLPSRGQASHLAQYALLARLGLGVAIRVQSSFLAGGDSVPQPDLAVVPGNAADYAHVAPSKAHLIIEVALSSLVQDRLTKSAIYARAGVPCYWIVNLRERCVEVYREPDRWRSEYRSVVRATGSDILVINDFPGIAFEADKLLLPADSCGNGNA